jgi:hypothetical protein
MYTSRDAGRCVWSNSEVIIIRGKPKKLKNLLQCHFIHMNLT